LVNLSLSKKIKKDAAMSKLEKLLPPIILRWSKSYSWKRWENRSNQEIFEEIYANKIWGKSPNSADVYFSGGGSHGAEVVSSYVKSVKKFLSSLKNKPVIVDIGCGDFNIGKNFLTMAKKYVGCDVVPSLIDFNKKKHCHKNLSFIHLDAVRDELPKGEVVIIRQVLQHLSNAQVQSVLTKIILNYDYLILTEHLPKKENFVANVDIPVGHLIRANVNSGLDIEKPPLNFKAKSKKIIDEISHSGGKIQTIVYEL